MPDAAGRYLKYLGTFGIERPGRRVVEHVSLRLGAFRAYSLDSPTSGPYRAFAAGDGLVAPGQREGDAWHAFLGAGAAVEVAGRIAWLESTESGGPHHPATGMTLAISGAAVPFPADPALRDRVEPPQRGEAADGTRTLTAWYLPAGREALECWRITAPRHGPARFHIQAYDGQPSAADVEPRAGSLLASPRAEERHWAASVFAARAASPAARAHLPDLVALLADADAGVREAAANALGRIGDARAVAPLAENCVRREDPGERRHLVQVLSTFGDEAVDALARLADADPTTDVRLEAVHALNRIDTGAARARLAGLARDRDGAVRRLAESYAGIAR